MKSFLEEKQKLLFFFLSTVILTEVEGSVFEGSVPIRTAWLIYDQSKPKLIPTHAVYSQGVEFRLKLIKTDW